MYPYPASYAHEHGELEQYRASHKANIVCRDAIDTAIADHYRDNRLGNGAVKQVVEQFGYDRTLYVLANTVRQKDWDGRISRENKEWAKTIPVYEDKDSWGGEFVVDRAHTGLMDLFTTQARREYLLTQPLTKEDIQQEAARLLGRLQEPSQPNSSSGTHFMAQMGTINREAYLRKMAIDGYVVKLDLPEIKELLSLMRRSSNNLNQLMKRVHETGRVYDADMADIVQKQNDIWDGLNKVLTQLGSIS